MPPLPRLPPLPPPSIWRTVFTKNALRASAELNARDYKSRVLLANPQLCDEFARAILIRKNEVILDTFCGPGQLTRSLLRGGKREPEAVSASDTVSKAGTDGIVAKAVEAASSVISGTTIGSKGDTVAENSKGEIDLGTHYKPNTPALVVAIEPSTEIIYKGFGDKHLDSAGLIDKFANYLLEPPATRCYPLVSANEPNLLVVPGSPYAWPEMEAVLSDQLVASRLERLDACGEVVEDFSASKSGTRDTTSARNSGANAATDDAAQTTTTNQDASDQRADEALIQATQRKWTDPEPPITFVSHIPDSTLGEQLVAQWIGSAVGDEVQGRRWIWRWGRIRLALLMGKGLYDRLSARPGEVINCKLSVMTRALFHVSPLPPYHHVYNVDKSSNLTESRSSAAQERLQKESNRRRRLSDERREPKMRAPNTKSKQLADAARLDESNSALATATAAAVERDIDAKTRASQDSNTNTEYQKPPPLTYASSEQGRAIIAQDPALASAQEAEIARVRASRTDGTGTIEDLDSPLRATRHRTTYYDFFPNPSMKLLPDHGQFAHPRPPLLGVMLTPRLDSVIKPSQRDDWDFVLRRCFVREASPIGEVVKGLAFGGDTLVRRMMAVGEIDGKVFAGSPVDPAKIVRDLEVEEWQRIVDAFSRWAFKPEMLILDSSPTQESSAGLREIGQD